MLYFAGKMIQCCRRIFLLATVSLFLFSTVSSALMDNRTLIEVYFPDKLDLVQDYADYVIAAAWVSSVYMSISFVVNLTLDRFSALFLFIFLPYVYPAIYFGVNVFAPDSFWKRVTYAFYGVEKQTAVDGEPMEEPIDKLGKKEEIKKPTPSLYFKSSKLAVFFAQVIPCYEVADIFLRKILYDYYGTRFLVEVLLIPVVLGILSSPLMTEDSIDSSKKSNAQTLLRKSYILVTIPMYLIVGLIDKIYIYTKDHSK